MTRIPALWLGLCLAVQAMPAAAPPVPEYRLEMDVYVIDEMALCESAWSLAVADHGELKAEAMLMRNGEFDAGKCVNVTFLKFHPPGVMGARVEVRQQ